MSESRYAVLDNGYRDPGPPIESRYAALESDYRRAAGDVDYGRVDPGYARPEVGAGYGQAEPGYARPEVAAGPGGPGGPGAPGGYGQPEPAYGRPEVGAGYGQAEPGYGRPEPTAGRGRADLGTRRSAPENDYGRPETPGYGRAEPEYGRPEPAAGYGRVEPDYVRGDQDYGRAEPGAYGRVDPAYPSSRPTPVGVPPMGAAQVAAPPVGPAPVGAGPVGAASVPVTGPMGVPMPSAGAAAVAPMPTQAPVAPPLPDPVPPPGPVTAAARVAPVRGAAAARAAAVPANGNGYGQGRVEWRDGEPDVEVERAVSVLRRDLGTPRVLAFANPKGGVHKTTATVLAAATVGSVRGRGVLAWDDNELRGTLGLRAGSARHARTIRHLITDLAEVEIRNGTDLTGRLDDYLRHASDGSYNVLAGEESPRFASRLDKETVRRVLDLLRRTQDVICVDTGNNVESVNWQTVIQAADQLVVTTVPREDAAFAADWMLDLLHEVGMGELADNAVTLVSCPTPGRSPLQADLERHFATRTRAVVVVPYDPALESGSSIEYANLQHETRQAWLKAASVMVEPFAR
ncbi:AAA family ATPase [Micromonospora sp. NPDC050417]|uniref:AAA family ATPase n=1 Tax=Micromonospora sp. NPDC050417 TaxID=3364280 RepID=UPI003787A2E4